MESVTYEETLEIGALTPFSATGEPLVLPATDYATHLHFEPSERLPRMDGYLLSEQQRFRNTLLFIFGLILFVWTALTWLLIFYPIHF